MENPADTKASGNDENISPNSNINSKSEQTVENNVTQLVAKEHFVFTDPEGQLYHFSVEGNTIRDGTKVMMFRYELQFWRLNIISKT